MVTGRPGTLHATPVPVLPVVDAAGMLTGLRGHLARANPHAAALIEEPRASFLFTGPNSYVSPSWLSDRTRAPTWYYACAQVEAQLSLVNDASGISAILQETVIAMEEPGPDAWAMAEMGSRYARLAQAVVGFEATLTARGERFKLGQHDRDDVLGDVKQRLDLRGAKMLLAWVNRLARI
jgi:transcriptional regulator